MKFDRNENICITDMEIYIEFNYKLHIRKNAAYTNSSMQKYIQGYTDAYIITDTYIIHMPRFMGAVKNNW